MRAFLHFVCAFLLCENFRRSKGGACLPRKSFEAENIQCVDVVLSMRVEGVVELLQRPFAVMDALQLVRFPCRYGSTCLRLSLNQEKTTFCAVAGVTGTDFFPMVASD